MYSSKLEQPFRIPNSTPKCHHHPPPWHMHKYNPNLSLRLRKPVPYAPLHDIPTPASVRDTVKARNYAIPPRRASTKCSVAPPSRLYSEAVLSSALQQIASASASAPYTKAAPLPFPSRIISSGLSPGTLGGSSQRRIEDAHLFPAVNQPLLRRRNPLLLLDALFYT